ERQAPRPREAATPSRPATAAAEVPGSEPQAPAPVPGTARKIAPRGKTPAHAEDRRTPLMPTEPNPQQDEIGELEEAPEAEEEESVLLVLPDEEEEDFQAAAPVRQE